MPLTDGDSDIVALNEGDGDVDDRGDDDALSIVPPSGTVGPSARGAGSACERCSTSKAPLSHDVTRLTTVSVLSSRTPCSGDDASSDAVDGASNESAVASRACGGVATVGNGNGTAA